MFKIKDAWQIVEEVSTEGTWTDVRDGQVYPYKQFGNQIWMTVNFNYGGKQGDWVQNTTAQSEGHAWRYKNTQDYEDWNSVGIDRGAFYTLDSVRSWVVPEGWHIPTKAEWDTLVNWAVSKYGNTSKARPALMAKTTKWRSAQTLYPWDDFGLAGFNMIPSGYMTSSDSGLWGDSSLAWNTCIYRVPNSSIATEARVEKTMFNSNTSILFRDQDTWSTQAVTIRLVKDSGAYVPQPAISTIVTSLDSTGSDNKIPTEKAIRSAISSATSDKMINPMTTSGDMVYGGASGSPTRLPLGTVGQSLSITTSGIRWTDPSGGAVSSIGDTDSVHLDLDGSAKLTAEVRISDTSGNQLEIVTTSGHEGLYVPEPTSLYLGAFDSRNRPQSANTGDYILDTDLGYIIYRYGDAWINATGTVLEGTVEPSVNYPVRWMENPMTTSGDLIVGGADGNPEVLTKGALGQVLTVGNTGLEYKNISENVSLESIPHTMLTGTTDIGGGPYAMGVKIYPQYTLTFNMVRIEGGSLSSGQYGAAIYKDGSLLVNTDTPVTCASSNVIDIPVPETTIHDGDDIWVFYSGSNGYKARSRNSMYTSPVVMARSSFIYNWAWKSNVSDYTVSETYYTYIKLWKE